MNDTTDENEKLLIFAYTSIVGNWGGDLNQFPLRYFAIGDKDGQKILLDGNLEVYLRRYASPDFAGGLILGLQIASTGLYNSR